MSRLNGCHNRPPLAAYRTVQDGLKQVGFIGVSVRMTEIQNFSHGAGCEYTKSALGQADQGCTGCKHKVSTKGAE